MTDIIDIPQMLSNAQNEFANFLSKEYQIGGKEWLSELDEIEWFCGQIGYCIQQEQEQLVRDNLWQK